MCLIKSGSDFQEFSDIRVNLIDGTIERESIDGFEQREFPCRPLNLGVDLEFVNRRVIGSRGESRMLIYEIF